MKKFTNFITEENKPLRSVRVEFENGDSYNTSMASHLTDEEIHDYFKVGAILNIGLGPNDNMQTISNCVILDSQSEPSQEPVMSESNTNSHDFIMEYRDELKDALLQAKAVSDCLSNISEEQHATIQQKLESILSRYDDYIEKLLYRGGRLTVTELVDAAISNEARHGTEPQFMLEAIESVYNMLLHKGLVKDIHSKVEEGFNIPKFETYADTESVYGQEYQEAIDRIVAATVTMVNDEASKFVNTGKVKYNSQYILEEVIKALEQKF